MLYALIFYGSCISVIAVVITVWDKCAAKRHRRRIPEKTLMWIGILGGAAAMLLTMYAIRHKTRKPKFMIGLPLCMLLHLVCGTAIWL